MEMPARIRPDAEDDSVEVYLDFTEIEHDFVPIPWLKKSAAREMNLAEINEIATQVSGGEADAVVIRGQGGPVTTPH